MGILQLFTSITSKSETTGFENSICRRTLPALNIYLIKNAKRGASKHTIKAAFIRDVFLAFSLTK